MTLKIVQALSQLNPQTFPILAPTNTKGQFFVYNIVSMVYLNSFQGRCRYADTTMQVDVYDESFKGVMGAMSAISTAIENEFSGLVTVSSTRTEMSDDAYRGIMELKYMEELI